MKSKVAAIDVPSNSEISRHVAGAYFYDSYELPITSASKSALEIYLGVVAKTPQWVNTLMSIRNRAVTLVGLKNLGNLSDIKPSKSAGDYKVGDRIGIFSLLFLSENEIILGDSDKHLEARVSICKIQEGTRHSVAVSTVVHIHNMLGRVYLFFVVPVHKIIVPAMLKKIASNTSSA
ncbi:MAG: hypothetical protein RL020_1830 [Pseudomonadota bacterium]|jgi:hypothetical protein